MRYKIKCEGNLEKLEKLFTVFFKNGWVFSKRLRINSIDQLNDFHSECRQESWYWIVTGYCECKVVFGALRFESRTLYGHTERDFEEITLEEFISINNLKV